MIIETLKDFQDTQETPGRNVVPREYKKIKENFMKAKNEGRELLVENSSFRYPYSVVMKLEYVGNRWCMGKVRYLHYGKEILVPYTIHYSDIYSGESVNYAAKNMNIVFKGGNPFGEGYKQGTEEDS